MRFSLFLVAASAFAAGPSFDKSLQPVITKYCAGCHNAKAKTGGLSLAFASAADAEKAPEILENVRKRLAAGTMPPKGLPHPAVAESAAANAWIEAALKRIAAHTKPDPGRVTAHRLNKYEYNKTVEDLLAVKFRPADDFPADDSGYGFDNIGDVLSISPVLMEKYLAAADKISRLAVGTDPLPAAAAKRYRNAPSPGRNLHEMQVQHRIIYDADYDVRAGLGGRRNDGAPNATVVIFVDGREAQRFEVDVKGDKPRTFDARLHLDGGPHEMRVKLLDDAYDVTVTANRDRNVVLDYIEVRGPYAAKRQGLSPSQQRVFICGHLPGQHQPECPRRIVSDLARRAWRRPVTDAEVEKLMRFVAMAQEAGDSTEEGIRVALQAMLVSPHFLFRIERDLNPESPTAVHPLGAFELASRLSYFLWSSMPDEELFQAAQSGKLATPAVLRAQVTRMLKDRKSERLVENFAGQWLELRNLDSLKPDPKRFPEFDESLRTAMKMETTLFFDSIVREDRSLTDFIDARYTYLNERLAKHYGIAGVSGPEFRKVELEGAQRGGVLTQASVLTVSSYPTRTSPVLRGKWLLENILGAPPPPPPPDVPPLDEKKIDAGMSLRQQMEQHRANPVCAACHVKMDPLGFAFENYDAVGRYRINDGKATIDPSGALPDGRQFRGAGELKTLLKAQAPDFARCLTEKMLTYALGRGLERYDRAAVDGICRKMSQSGYRFSSMITGIVTSLPFQNRRGEAVQEGTRR